MNVNQLPETVLVAILEHLSMETIVCNVALVCRKWHQLSQDSVLWRITDLRKHRNMTDDAVLRLSRSVSTRHLFVANCPLLTDVAAASAHWSHLRSLDLSDCESLSRASLLSLADHCCHLERVRFVNLPAMTDEALGHLGLSCPHLRVVELAGCDQVTDDALAVVVTHCKLSSILLARLPKVRGTFLKSVGHPEAVSVISLRNTPIEASNLLSLTTFSRLKRLHVRGNKRVSSSLLRVLLQSCKELDNVDLSCCCIDDDAVRVMATAAPHLLELHLGHCTDITDQALHYISDLCPAIVRVDCSFCDKITDAGVMYISQRASSLRHLDLVRCDGIHERCVEQMLQLHPDIHYSTAWLFTDKRRDTPATRRCLRSPVPRF